MSLTRVGLLVALAACGNDPAMDGDDAPPPDAGEITPTGYTRLIGRTWELPAGANIYKCARMTVPADMYITTIIVEKPIGTHHMLLSIAGANDTAGPDGEQDCGPTNIGMYLLYGAGVGTPPLEFPANVAIKVTAGQQLHLNLHLLNTSDEPLSGESVILVKTQAEPPPMLAEMVLAGPLDLDIPPTGTPVSFTGECHATTPHSLFAVWPHMHRLGKRQTVELEHDGATTIVLDKEYTFDEQGYYPISPTAAVATGDCVRVTCTFVNAGTEHVYYGDGPTSEMCFAGLYRFPATGSNEYCPE